MARETYTLTEADMNAIYVALKAYNPATDLEAYEGSVNTTSLMTLETMFEVAEAATVTYEAPEEEVADEEPPLCGNCAKELPMFPFSDYACSEACEEAILERKHQEEVASGEATDVCSMCGQELDEGVPPSRDENDNPCHADCLAVEEAVGPVPFTPDGPPSWQIGYKG